MVFICSHIRNQILTVVLNPICFHICELFIPCSQGILYIALRNQKSTHVFTKGMDSVNREGNSNTLFSVTNLMYLIYFCLKYFCFLGGGHFGRRVGHRNFLCTRVSHITFGFQSSNQRDNQRLFLMQFMGRKKHLMLYPKGKISDFD